MLEASNVLTDDIEFDVHLCPHFYAVKIGVLVGVRNDAHLKCVVRPGCTPLDSPRSP